MNTTGVKVVLAYAYAPATLARSDLVAHFATVYWYAQQTPHTYDTDRLFLIPVADRFDTSLAHLIHEHRESLGPGKSLLVHCLSPILC